MATARGASCPYPRGVHGMSGFHGSAARRSVELCVVIGLLGACATGRQGASSSQDTPSQPVESHPVERLTEDCTGREAERCVALGMSYATGSGVPTDERRAAALFEKACAGGSAQGCFTLGLGYAAGRGVPQDARRAA